MTTPAHWNFNDAAVNAIFDHILGFASQSGRFDAVNAHEPKNAPPDPSGVTFACWIQETRWARRAGSSQLPALWS
jgi:hypothetical protein